MHVLLPGPLSLLLLNVPRQSSDLKPTVKEDVISKSCKASDRASLVRMK